MELLKTNFLGILFRKKKRQIEAMKKGNITNPFREKHDYFMISSKKMRKTRIQYGNFSIAIKTKKATYGALYRLQTFMVAMLNVAHKTGQYVL